MARPIKKSVSIHARAAQLQAVARYPLAPDEFERLRDLLAIFCGVYLDTARQRVLEQAVARRLQTTGSSYATYERNLRAERDELRRLAELVLNHETYFFRNQPHIRALQEVLIPELHRKKPKGEPIRIWSAGCSTGEEAYSLAITALQALPFHNRPVEIWATDLSDVALEIAREGLYAGRSISQVEPALLQRYFEPSGDALKINSRVQSMVQFERLNLLEPLPDRVGTIDIVFCQNVIIYFQLATSRAFLNQLYSRLPEGGMLCLGFSETLWNMFEAFHTREVLGAYVYYKDTRPAQRAATAAKPQPAPPAQRPAPQARPRLPRPAAPKPKAAPRPSMAQAPSDLEALRQGRAYIEEGKTEQALDILRQIPPHAPFAAEAITLIARAHADRGQIDQALAEARRVIEIAPMSDEAALLLGILYSRQGMWDEAITQLERARYLNSAAPLVSFYLAEAYQRRNRKEHALREYRNTLWKLRPYPPDLLVDGVAVQWLHDTCQRQIAQLSRQISE